MINSPYKFFHRCPPLFGLFLISCLTHAQAVDDINSTGEFEIKQNDGAYQSALLLDTHIQGNVNGLVGQYTCDSNLP